MSENKRTHRLEVGFRGPHAVLSGIHIVSASYDQKLSEAATEDLRYYLTRSTRYPFVTAFLNGEEIPRSKVLELIGD